MVVFSGKRLKSLRQEHNISQKEMANVLGVSRPTVTKYESGERQPEPKVMAKLLDFFDVSLDYLFERSGVKNAEKMLIEQSYLNIFEFMERTTDEGIAKLLEQTPFVELQNNLKQMDNVSQKKAIEVLNVYLHLLAKNAARTHESTFHKEIFSIFLEVMKELSWLNGLFFDDEKFEHIALLDWVKAQTKARNNINIALDDMLDLHVKRTQ